MLRVKAVPRSATLNEVCRPDPLCLFKSKCSVLVVWGPEMREQVAELKARDESFLPKDQQDRAAHTLGACRLEASQK